MAYGYESYYLTHIKTKRDEIKEKARAYEGYQPTDADSLNPDLDRAPESYVADTKNQATRERALKTFRQWVADAKRACGQITTQLDKPPAPLGQYFNATDENQCYDLLTKSPQEQYKEQEARAGRSDHVEEKVRNAKRDLEDRKVARYNTYLAMAEAHPQIAGSLRAAAVVGYRSDNPDNIRDFLGIDPQYVLGIYLRSAAARNTSEAAQRAQEAEGGGLSESQLEWLSTALSFFPPTMPVMAASDTVQFLERIRKGEQLSGSEYIFAAVGVFGGVKTKSLFGIGRELGAITAADRRLVVGHFGPQYSGIVERILTSIPPLSAEDAKLVATGLEKLRRGQPPTPQATAKIIDFFGKIRDMMRNANARAMGIADLLSPGTRSRVTVGVGEVIVPGKKPIKLVSTSEPNTIRRAVAETVPPGQLQIGVGHAEHQIITALEDMFGIQLTGVLATSRPHCPLCKAEMKGKIIPASLFRRK